MPELYIYMCVYVTMCVPGSHWEFAQAAQLLKWDSLLCT